MVLDYQTTCGACSTPLTSPPRDGADSMCAHLHTAAGQAAFMAICHANRRKQEIVNKTPVNTDLLTPDEQLLTDDVNNAPLGPDLLTPEEVLLTGEFTPEETAKLTRAEYMREYMRRRRAQ